MRKLVRRYDDRAALECDWRDNLRHGRAFVPDATGADRMEAVRLILVHPSDRSQLTLSGTVVLEQDGLGVAIEGFDDATSARVKAFVERASTAGAGARRSPTSIQERMRELPAHQQQKLARTGELHERVALERLCGKAVWDALLQNPKLTVPEVAKIARKATVPRLLLDQICENAAWVRAGPVRRALLSNTRLSPEGLNKLLRAMPKRELKLIEKQTAYPSSVREAARRFKLAGG